MKTRTFTLMLFFFFLLGLVNAQEGFQLGVDFFPNYSWHTNPAINSADYKGKLSQSIGLYVEKGLAKRLSIQTGVNYATIGTTYESTDDLRWGLQHDGNGGFDSKLESGESISRFSTANTLHFIEIPLKLRYVVVDKAYQVYFSQALLGRFFINEYQKTSVEIAGNNETEREKLDTEIASPSTAWQSGIGCSFPLAASMRMYVEPRFQLNTFSPVAANSRPVDVKFGSIGLAMGINFMSL
jgi:hypothetical protein